MVSNEDIIKEWRWDKLLKNVKGISGFAANQVVGSKYFFKHSMILSRMNINFF